MIVCTSHRPLEGADSAPRTVPAGVPLSCDLCSRFRADLGLFVYRDVILRRCGDCKRRTDARAAAMLS
jgi:hypothetical protein